MELSGNDKADDQLTRRTYVRATNSTFTPTTNSTATKTAICIVTDTKAWDIKVVKISGNVEGEFDLNQSILCP